MSDRFASFPPGLPLEGLARLLERSPAGPRAALGGRRPGRSTTPELSYGRHRGPASHDARRAAVAVLLYFDRQWMLPLTLRPRELPNHGGQISLPGGMLEPGEDPEACAQREWEEEMGVPARPWQRIGALPTVYVYASNFLVTPLVYATPRRPAWAPHPGEVEAVIETPVSRILAAAARPDEFVVQRPAVTFRAPCLHSEVGEVWGATFLILCDLAQAVQESHAA